MQAIVIDVLWSYVHVCVCCVCPKKAEPIEKPFWVWTWVGPRNHVLDGDSVPPVEGQIWGVPAM